MISFSQKQRDTINMPFEHTLEVNEGTPRSGKTTASVFRFAKFILKSDDVNHLIVAFSAELAFKLVIDGDGIGLLNIFNGFASIKNGKFGTFLEVLTPKGVRRIFCRGGGLANSHKSIAGMSFGSVYFCEIDLLNIDMIHECFRRTFAAKHRWHIADLNPPSPHHPVISQVFDAYDTLWQHWTAKDNPILTPKKLNEIESSLSKNPHLYSRDWLGLRVVPKGVIYSMFDPSLHIVNSIRGSPIELFFAADGGQGDATSMSANIVCRDSKDFILYRAFHYYHSGRESGCVKAMSVYAKELKAFIRFARERFPTLPLGDVFVDPACLSLREELRLLGINTRPAFNNAKDSSAGQRGLEVGIERAQNLIYEGRFFLLDTDTFGHDDFLREISLYQRADSGKPADSFNHAMDEFRYGVNYFYREYIAF